MSTQFVYQALAAHYQLAIEGGILRAGERMPSVRTLMRQHKISLTTALQVCRHMESLGLLEARPRSGYFVRGARNLPGAQEPALVLADPAQYVGIHQRVSSILAQGLHTPHRLNLAGACGAPELYPSATLAGMVAKVVRDKPGLLTEAAPAEGDAGFRTVLAKRALAVRMSIVPQDVIVTHGCIEALNLALRAVTQPGDVVAVESPTFYGLLQILETLGLRALEIPTSPHTGISLEALELAAQTYPDIKAVAVVPNFQNPLGAVIPDSHKRALVAWCERQQIPLIEDDTYSELGNDDEPLCALKSFDRTGNVIYCASLHKTLAPGMRLGWMTAGKWQARVQMLKYAQSRANSVPYQVAAGRYLDSPAFDRHLRHLRAKLLRQREQMAHAVASYFPAGTRLSVPPGGIALWVELPERRSAEAVFHAALAQGIRIAPGALYSNSTRYDHFMRLNTGLPFSNVMEDALRTLGKIVAEAPKVGEGKRAGVPRSKSKKSGFGDASPNPAVLSWGNDI